MGKDKIAIIGLGYVGLPLARLFATKYPVVGFDIDKNRISELMSGEDSTLEVDKDALEAVLICEDSDSNGLFCTGELEKIRDCNYYIITVPTPVDNNNRPVLTPLINASEAVGKVLRNGDIVIFESTVYPGATEEDCVPVLEKFSGLKFNKNFYAGYSPERINPGDREHTVEKIRKVTSGSTPSAGKKIDNLYRTVIEAGTYYASSIKVAEGSKVIENAQRDINIAFVNELAKIFNILGIDTHQVLEAAATKWNFLPFRPGLVGGHCIGVDPYYLAQKAQENGYHPEIILAGRRLNDGMGKYVAGEVVKLMMRSSSLMQHAKVLMLGITFKENCPDIRNTKAIEIYNELKEYNLDVDVYDPWASPEQVDHEFGITLLNKIEEKFSAIILAVGHDNFLNQNLRNHLVSGGIVYDVKGFLDLEMVDSRL
ncbi:nucleotide sugar dehydrogenase [Akkermansiaceae bacterium]|nr:nucleotide sugar dehydrogenase [Akkermansiaceae bacterium]